MRPTFRRRWGACLGMATGMLPQATEYGTIAISFFTARACCLQRGTHATPPFFNTLVLHAARKQGSSNPRERPASLGCVLNQVPTLDASHA